MEILYWPMSQPEVVLRNDDVVLVDTNITTIDTNITYIFTEDEQDVEAYTGSNTYFVTSDGDKFLGQYINNYPGDTEAVIYIPNEVAVLTYLEASVLTNVTFICPFGAILQSFTCKNIDQIRLHTSNFTQTGYKIEDFTYGPITNAPVLVNNTQANHLFIDSSYAKIEGNVSINYFDIHAHGSGENGLAIDGRDLKLLKVKSFNWNVEGIGNDVELAGNITSSQHSEIIAVNSTIKTHNSSLIQGPSLLCTGNEVDIDGHLSISHKLHLNAGTELRISQKPLPSREITLTFDNLTLDPSIIDIEALEDLVLNLRDNFENTAVLKAGHEVAVVGQGKFINSNGILSPNLNITAGSFENSGFINLVNGDYGIKLNIASIFTNTATGNIHSDKSFYISGIGENTRVPLLINYGKITAKEGPHEIHADEMKVLTEYYTKYKVKNFPEMRHRTRSSICYKLEKHLMKNDKVPQYFFNDDYLAQSKLLPSDNAQILLDGGLLFDVKSYHQNLGIVKINGKLHNVEPLMSFHKENVKLDDYYDCRARGKDNKQHRRSIGDAENFLNANDAHEIIDREMLPQYIGFKVMFEDSSIPLRKKHREDDESIFLINYNYTEFELGNFSYLTEHSGSSGRPLEIDFDNMEDARIDTYKRNEEEKTYPVAVIDSNGEITTKQQTLEEVRRGGFFASNYFGKIVQNLENPIFIFNNPEIIAIGPEIPQGRFDPQMFLNTIYGDDSYSLLENEILPHLHSQKTRCIEAVGMHAVNNLITTAILNTFGVEIGSDNIELGLYLIENGANIRMSFGLEVGEPLSKAQISVLDRPIAWLVYDQETDCYRFKIYLDKKTEFIDGGLYSNGKLLIKAKNFHSSPGTLIGAKEVDINAQYMIAGGSIISKFGTKITANQLAIAGTLGVDDKGDLYVNSSKQCLNLASNVYTNAGDAIFDIGGDILSKVALDSSGNIINVPTFRIKGNLSEKSGGSIIEYGVFRWVNGNWEFEAQGSISQQTYQQIKTLIDIATKRSRILMQTVLQAEDIAFVQGHVNIKAGEKYMGLGNIIKGKQGITLITYDGVESRTITAYAQNHQYLKEKKLTGRSSVSISYSEGKTSQAQFESEGQISITSTECTFEGIDINSATINDEKDLGKKVKIKCSDGSEFLAHKIKNNYHVVSSQSGVGVKVPALDIMKSHNPVKSFVESAGILSSLNQIAHMKGPLDLAGFTKLLSEAAQVNNMMKPTKDKNGNIKPGMNLQDAVMKSMLDGIVKVGFYFSNIKHDMRRDTEQVIPNTINGAIVGVESEGNVKMEATKINSTTIYLHIGGNLTLISAEEGQEASSKTTTKSLDLSINLQGVRVGVSGSRSTSMQSQWHNIGTELNAGKNVTIVVGDEFSIKGGAIKTKSGNITAQTLIIDDVLDTMRSESNSVGGSAGVTFTGGGMIPDVFVSFGNSKAKQGMLFMENGITGEKIVITAESLTYNHEHITGDAEFNVNNINECPRPEEYKTSESMSVAAGFYFGADGKLHPTLESSYQKDDVVVSFYASPDVLDGLNLLKDAISSPDNPASNADKRDAAEILEQVKEKASEHGPFVSEEAKDDAARRAEEIHAESTHRGNSANMGAGSEEGAASHPTTRGKPATGAAENLIDSWVENSMKAAFNNPDKDPKMLNFWGSIYSKFLVSAKTEFVEKYPEAYENIEKGFAKFDEATSKIGEYVGEKVGDISDIIVGEEGTKAAKEYIVETLKPIAQHIDEYKRSLSPDQQEAFGMFFRTLDVVTLGELGVGAKTVTVGVGKAAVKQGVKVIDNAKLILKQADEVAASLAKSAEDIFTPNSLKPAFAYVNGKAPGKTMCYMDDAADTGVGSKLFRQADDGVGGEVKVGGVGAKTAIKEDLATTTGELSDSIITPKIGETLKSEIAFTESILKDKAKFIGEYNLHNPGVLSKEYAETFSGYRYKAYALEEDCFMYRSGVSSNSYGNFYSFDNPVSEIQVRIDKAIMLKWRGGAESPIDTVFKVKIPKGTEIYTGDISYQGDLYLGGTHQVLIPNSRKIPGIEVVESYPINKNKK